MHKNGMLTCWVKLIFLVIGRLDILAHFINMNKIKGTNLNALNAAKNGPSKE
jgi:hypothetical protein